jgi:hypothetical protein
LPDITPATIVSPIPSRTAPVISSCPCMVPVAEEVRRLESTLLFEAPALTQV